MGKYTKDHQKNPGSEEVVEKVPEITMTTKDVPAYKQVYEQMKQDPEIGWLMKTEGYEKASIVILYQILEELRKK
jgi:hypothetical protein